ncbi:MAG TPA: SRPBCC family protein [Roseiflexaceae bacterium]
MSAPTDHPTEALADREIVSTRVFDAPHERVFRAFSDPSLLVRWWGPKDFTNMFHEFDLRPGGAWRFIMHGPDGTDYQTAKEFIEVVRPERIVLQHPDPLHRFQMTMTFAEEAGTTRLTWRMLFESAAEFEQVRAFIPAVNEQNFDRLEAQLATMA